MKKNPFYKQAELMVRVLPYVAAEKCFGLKGGTAINLFLRDMPRLSVDIDLTYLPIEPRDVSLKNIHEALKRISEEIKKFMPSARVQEGHAAGTKRISKLFVSYQGVQIKIEPNEVIRGTVYPCEERDLMPKAEQLFELSVSVNALSLADLFGGKLCAALDRQHPRDLFDVKLLLENEGITDRIRKAFVVYLASHDRPIHELIDPNRQDIRSIYENEFSGMTAVPVRYEDLIEAREVLISILKKDFSPSEKQFLLSLKEGEPRWELLGIEGIENLPAIQWKVINVRKMEKKKREVALEKLKKKLEV